MKGLMTSIWILACTADLGLFAQENPQFTYSLTGPCGQILEGFPGTEYDDGTGGRPEFQTNRQGHTWDVVLTTANNLEQFGTLAWSFGLGVEGAVTITDITTGGTPACLFPSGPTCLRTASGFDITELTGLPFGQGPATEGNSGAISYVFLGGDNVHFLPPNGNVVICRIRVFATFPEIDDEVVSGKIFFVTRTGSRSFPISPVVFFPALRPITLDEGNPPLQVQECEVRFKAIRPVAAFIRCDANNDGRSDISDSIWILNQLFGRGSPTSCPASADCNGDGSIDISDASFGISYQFLGGLSPPSPFPNCGKSSAVQTEKCPPGSTACP